MTDLKLVRGEADMNRLAWRCRRGTKELDMLLQSWLTREYTQSGEALQQAFLALLEWSDDRLIQLLLGGGQADDPQIDELAGRIRALSLSRP